MQGRNRSFNSVLFLMLLQVKEWKVEPLKRTLSWRFLF